MVEARLAAWRGRGAARFDALRFGFVEALARRTAAHQGTAAARAVLEARLMAALQAYAEHFDAAEAEATRWLTEATARFPAAGEGLRQCHAAGDFGALRRQVAALQIAAAPGPWGAGGRAFGLDGATAGLAGSANGPPETQPAGPAGPELKAATRFRKTWARLGAEKRLRESLAQAPGNAGPLNSHGLVLRALQRMHAVSPDYLSRWVAQVDALLWIEQAARAVGRDRS